MIQTRARVVANEAVNREHRRITLSAPEIASAARPGQFVNIRVRDANAPLCRRPFTVFRGVDLGADGAGIEIVYRIVGLGTRLLAATRPGEDLDVIGPLGTGYRIDASKAVHILVGGGCGAAALYSLGRHLSRLARKDREGAGIELLTILGFRSRDAVMLEEEFAALGGELTVATDDGSYGRRGYAVDILKGIIEQRGIADDCAVYASGPEPMNRALVAYCRERGISGQLTMEKHMLCGFGACLTCVCEVDKAGVSRHRDLAESHIQLSPASETGHALVCRDGPVFNVDEVVFE